MTDIIYGKPYLKPETVDQILADNHEKITVALVDRCGPTMTLRQFNEMMVEIRNLTLDSIVNNVEIYHG